jgi:predicted RNase H-like HicB family nuclease
MSVVEDVGTDMDDEREPTWDEAIAAFNRAAPVELVRSPRRITVVYRYTDGIFTATSPDVRGFRVTARSLHEARAAVREDLDRFLDPAVEVLERIPAPDPEICTAAVGRNSLVAGSLPGLIVLSSSGTAGTFVSSPRTSRLRARVS